MHDSETLQRTRKIIFIGHISVYIGLLILCLRHFFVYPADHFLLVSIILAVGFFPSMLLSNWFSLRYISYILVANALLIVSFVFSFMHEWALDGVFILVPVFSLLFKESLLYVATSAVTLGTSLLLSLRFLYASNYDSQHIVIIIDLLTIFLILVFLIYFVSRDMVKQSTMEAKHLQTIMTLSRSVEAKDPYTYGHSDRVAAIAQLIARQIPTISAQSVFYSGLIHDIGKLSIPDSILLKNTGLTETEYQLIKTHTKQGAEICSSLEMPKLLIDGVLYHHERWDGKGYPSGLKAEQIPLIGRIICVADSIDAMSSNRAYRSSLEFEWIKKELKKCSGSQFDPTIIDIVMEHWNEIMDYITAYKVNAMREDTQNKQII